MPLLRKLPIIIFFFNLLPSFGKISSSQVEEVYYSGTDLTLAGTSLTSRQNPFTAYLLSEDGEKFDLEVEEIAAKAKKQSIILSIPFVEKTSIFDLYTYGGSVSEDDPQVFQIMIGKNPDDNGSVSNYWIEGDYDAGLLRYSLSTEGEIESLKGDTGDQGLIGEQGLVGETGPAGESSEVNFSGGTVPEATSFSSLVTLDSSLKFTSSSGSGKILKSSNDGTASWQVLPSPGVSSLNEMPDAKLSGGSIFIGEGFSNSLNNAQDNIIVGYEAGNGLTTGDREIGIGYRALYSNTSGFSSTAIGYRSSEKSLNAGYATSIGALTTASQQHGSYVTALGKSALYNYPGVYALGIGVEAAYTFNSTYMVAIGNSAFRNVTGASYMTAIGNNAGKDAANLNGITIVGHNSGLSANSLGQTIIGNNNELPGSAGNYYTDIGDLVYINNAKIGINQSDTVRELNISDVMRLEPRASAPGTPSLGDIYVDSDTNELCFYDGSAWYGIRASQACS